MIRIMKYGEVPGEEIFARVTPTVNVEKIVSDIIANVRKYGDKALFSYSEQFDRAKLSQFAVTKEEMDEALAAVEPKFLEILNRAADNIRKFHRQQVRGSFILNEDSGIVMGQKIIPIERVGLYVPGSLRSLREWNPSAR